MPIRAVARVAHPDDPHAAPMLPDAPAQGLRRARLRALPVAPPAVLLFLLLAAPGGSAAAQNGASAATRRATPAVAPGAAAPLPALAGTWSGTATVPLGDSTVVVPVRYTFTESAAGLAGTATVPGQATGTIGSVVREGATLRFRVTVPQQGVLDHAGQFGAGGVLEGMVQVNNQPVARFKVTREATKTP